MAARPARRVLPRSHKLDSVLVDDHTRLLVIAPHPDDEVLAAGGLMQQVHDAHGTVNVVYLTSGEGYLEGVQAQEHVAAPTASEFRGYGRRREREARAALHQLGLGPESARFLGFPNGGLHRMMSTYWSERRAAFRSPYTRMDRPQKSELVLPNTEYRGEDLTQELAMIIGDIKPTTIVVPRKEDQHVDHCAAWFFLADALTDVQRVDPAYHADLLTYVIHYFSWPLEDDDPRIEPPDGLGPRRAEWRSVTLTDAELNNKLAAINRYKSQMKVMDWFLTGFARRNEVFARRPLPRIMLPVHRNPCNDFEEDQPPAAVSVRARMPRTP